MAEVKPEGPRRPVKGAARQTFGEAVNELVDREFVEGLLSEIRELKGLTRVYCPKCRQSLMAEVRDVPKIVGALTALLEQAEGRPSSVEEGGVVLVVERPAYSSHGG